MEQATESFAWERLGAGHTQNVLKTKVNE